MTNPRQTSTTHDKPQTNIQQIQQTLDVRYNKFNTQQTQMMFHVYDYTRHGKPKTDKHQTGQSLDRQTQQTLDKDITKAGNYKPL